VNVTLAPIDPVLRVADICRLLKISEAQFYALRESFFQKHGLLVEVQPRLDRMPRYCGEPFVKFLSDKNQQKLWRQELRALEPVVS
jgi:hypothetical protein